MALMTARARDRSARHGVLRMAAAPADGRGRAGDGTILTIRRGSEDPPKDTCDASYDRHERTTTDDVPSRLHGLRAGAARCGPGAVGAEPAARTGHAGRCRPSRAQRGQYDEVERLLRSATDARSIAIRARAEIARGRYAEAEKLLTPVASAQPGSDAALELGLLHMHLGRRGEAVRSPPFDRRASQTSRPQPITCGLVARRVRSVRFRTPNGFFRQANRLAPTDVADEHGVGRAVPREVRPQGSDEVLPGRAQGGRDVGACHPRRRAHRDRGESTGGEDGHRARAQDQPQLRCRAAAGRRDVARRTQT